MMFFWIWWTISSSPRPILYIFLRCQRDAALTNTLNGRMPFKLNRIGQCIYQPIPFQRPEGWRLAERRDRLICWPKSAVPCQHKSQHDCWLPTFTLRRQHSLCDTEYHEIAFDYETNHNCKVVVSSFSCAEYYQCASSSLCRVWTHSRWARTWTECCVR